MAKKLKDRSRSPGRTSGKKITVQGFYTPFKDLDQQVQGDAGTKSAVPHLPQVSKDPERISGPQDEEERAFREAMSGVVPLTGGRAERVPPARPLMDQPRFLVDEDLEVCSELADLVAGNGVFELYYSDEYVEGAISGTSPTILKKLRSGQFSYQDYLDLHGFKRAEARAMAVRFVRRSFAMRYRCVLIVSGRGLNSEGKEPVIKNCLVQWLTQAPLKRLVLAFSSACSYDGGAGAFYVLLRRNEGKARFVMPAG